MTTEPIAASPSPTEGVRGAPDEFWTLLHEWADATEAERQDAIEHRFNELFRLAGCQGGALPVALTPDALPPLPEAMVMVRDADPPGEEGGWIVDCDCEGPLTYSLEAGEALYTADQMREFALAALRLRAVPRPDSQQEEQ